MFSDHVIDMSLFALTVHFLLKPAAFDLLIAMSLVDNLRHCEDI